MAGFPSVPDHVERKGSLFLRSDRMNYSRATLNSNWHQAREAEPKEYDMNRDPERNLCKSTYSRIANVTDGELPETTYQNFCNQNNLKDEFTEKEFSKSMITDSSKATLNRDTGTPDSGYWAVLPKHNPEHNKYHLDTTHKADFKAPYPYTPAQEKPQEFADYAIAYKKCSSQFTDTADYRRNGRNTWQDESGVYTNSHHKVECPTYKKTDPFRIREAQMEAAVAAAGQS